MVKDALLLANDYFKFEEAIKTPETFLKLDDNILNTILTVSLNPDEEIRCNKKLLEAEKIVKRIYNREMYTIIGEIPIPLGWDEKPKLEDFLCNENPKDEFYLSEKDIELRKKTINFGFKNKNPFETIYFYNPKRPNECFKKSMEHLLVMPKVFSESTILVLCKDEKKIERAKKLFDIYKNKMLKKWNKTESPKKEQKHYFTEDKLFYDENENKNLETPRFGYFLNNKRERNEKKEFNNDK
jgi:hypothetical protein